MNLKQKIVKCILYNLQFNTPARPVNVDNTAWRIFVTRTAQFAKYRAFGKLIRCYAPLAKCADWPNVRT